MARCDGLLFRLPGVLGAGCSAVAVSEVGEMKPLPKIGHCSYCGLATRLVDGSVLYPAYTDLAERKFHWCEPCNAYVGTHKADNVTPLGTLAKPELRRLRRDAHVLFDRMWKGGAMSRSQAYRRLEKLMGVGRDEAHISWMDEEECRRLIEQLKTGWPTRQGEHA